MSESGQFLTKGDGVWHYQRRVPSCYAHLDPRAIIRLSTKIKVASDRAGNKASRVAGCLSMNRGVHNFFFRRHGSVELGNDAPQARHQDAVRDA